jgi:hypothetical protein
MQQLAEPALQPPVAEVRLERLPPAAWPSRTAVLLCGMTPVPGHGGAGDGLSPGPSACFVPDLARFGRGPARQDAPSAAGAAATRD